MAAASAPETTTSLKAEEEALPSLCQVASRLTSQAGPSVISYLFSFVPQLVNIIFIGRYGNKDQLAAVGLGNMMQNVFGTSIGIGLSCALDTLASQAHGSGEFKLACTYTQRARLILCLQLVWMGPLLTHCDVWLTAVGQDPTVARFAAEYNVITAPFLPLYFQAECWRRLLAAFLEPGYDVLITGIATVLHVAWAELFLGRMGLGNSGLGLANAVCWTTRFVMLAGVWWKIAPTKGLRRSWVLGFHRESLRGWCGFLQVGFPTLVQTSGEWWFWEILALVAGYLGNTALAAHVATFQFVTMPFMVPLGIGEGASMLVGNAIGAGSARLARRTCWMAVGMNIIAWAVVALTTVMFLHSIAAVLSKDADVQSIIRVLIVIYAVAGFADSSQTCMGSILRGLGETRIPSVTYVVTFYLIMLPLAILFAFPMEAGVKGIWLATGVGSSLAALVFTYVLYNMDYGELVRDARGEGIESYGSTLQAA